VDSVLKFYNESVLYILLPALVCVAIVRIYFYRGVRYRYPLSASLASQGATSKHKRSTIFFMLRFLLLLIFIILIAKPQLIDPRSKITLEGIDIVLVIDVSGSMSYPHHSADDRSKIVIAQQEAIRFVDKRTNDAIGLVVFGNAALSRCPITADKALLKSIIGEIEIGSVDPQGTVLSSGIITAANRLKHSKAKSKIMVVLTDGQPSQNDADHLIAIAIAKELGIKIYTVGIGDEQQQQQIFWYYAAPPLNKALLESIAHETGGKFFEAKNADDMRHIYDTIDTLEKNKIEAPIFGRQQDWFLPLLWIALVFIMSELLLSTFIWFGL